jgi:hypothetical protein
MAVVFTVYVTFTYDSAHFGSLFVFMEFRRYFGIVFQNLKLCFIHMAELRNCGDNWW